MSWLQWRGEVWPATEDEATLALHLWPPDSACPRQSWSCDLHHRPRELAEAGKPKRPRFAGLDLMDLNLQLDNWQDIGDREIRADASWHTLHETTNEYGHLNAAELQMVLGEMDPARRALGEKPHQHWIAHDWSIRLGAPAGFVIPVEIDAWMIPHDDYPRLEPESEEEIARFPEGPPNLRAMARARFSLCEVAVERCEDPIPRAREYLRRAIGLRLPPSVAAKVEWNSYRRLPDGKSEPRPGWTSVVVFDLPQE